MRDLGKYVEMYNKQKERSQSERKEVFQGPNVITRRNYNSKDDSQEEPKIKQSVSLPRIDGVINKW